MYSENNDDSDLSRNNMEDKQKIKDYVNSLNKEELIAFVDKLIKIYPKP